MQGGTRERERKQKQKQQGVRVRQGAGAEPVVTDSADSKRAGGLDGRDGALDGLDGAGGYAGENRWSLMSRAPPMTPAVGPSSPSTMGRLPVASGSDWR